MVEVRRTTLLHPRGKEYWYHIVIWVDYVEYLEQKGRQLPSKRSFKMTDEQLSALDGALVAADRAALREFNIDERDGVVVEGLTLASNPTWRA